MLTLDESMFIAKGSERKCYIHPEDDSKLIKIQFDNSIGRNQNDVDVFYYNYMTKHKKSFSHIPAFHGEVETNYGPGLVFSLIREYDKQPSKTFEQVVQEKLLSPELEIKLLSSLKRYLNENSIVFGDVVLSNVLCQEYEQGKYRLMIIDGLGSRRFNFKFWLQTHSSFFTKLRIKKQWRKFLSRYELVKSGSDTSSNSNCSA